MKKMDDEIFLVDIPGEVPAKKNSRVNTKSGKSFPSKSYRAWHDGSIVLLCAEARRQGLARPIDRPCAIFLIIWHGDHRRRDSDNVLSPARRCRNTCGRQVADSEAGEYCC